MVSQHSASMTSSGKSWFWCSFIKLSPCRLHVICLQVTRAVSANCRGAEAHTAQWWHANAAKQHGWVAVWTCSENSVSASKMWSWVSGLCNNTCHVTAKICLYMHSMTVAVHAVGKLGRCAVGCEIAKQSHAWLLACSLNPSIKHINSRTLVALNMYLQSEQSHPWHALLVDMQVMLSLCTKLTGIRARLAACLCTQNMLIWVLQWVILCSTLSQVQQ